MANVAVDTGHGATITLATSAHAFYWTAIDPGERVREAISTTHLGSTAPTYMQGDLQEHSDIVLDFQWDPKTTAAPATTTTAETLTITWPVVTSVGATLVGTALITKVKFPPLQTGTLQMGQLTLKPTGATPMAYTAGS